MIVQVTKRTSVGDVTEEVECRSWHVDKQTSALMFSDAGNMAFRSMSARYWLDVREVRDIRIET